MRMLFLILAPFIGPLLAPPLLEPPNISPKISPKMSLKSAPLKLNPPPNPPAPPPAPPSQPPHPSPWALPEHRPHTLLPPSYPRAPSQTLPAYRTAPGKRAPARVPKPLFVLIHMKRGETRYFSKPLCWASPVLMASCSTTRARSTAARSSLLKVSPQSGSLPMPSKPTMFMVSGS